ncbi:MAG TPA: hypothetical protein VH134_01085 [Candidatus Dormibacteraeota bacterium]|nr:hypothetical protein [Candidatus Dormibacteraeota bacterium]
MSNRKAIVLFIGAALSACACGASSPAPSATPTSQCTGIDRDKAITVARSSAESATPVTVISASCAHFRDVAHGSTFLGPDVLVWSVVFSGTFGHGSCGPAPIPPQTFQGCPAPAKTERVVVNASTGTFVMGEVPAQ